MCLLASCLTILNVFIKCIFHCVFVQCVHVSYANLITLLLFSGFLPEKHTEANRISMFTGRKMFGDTVE